MVAASCLALVSQGGLAQGNSNADGDTIKPTMTYHGISPTLEELSRHPEVLEPGAGQLIESEMEPLFEEPVLPRSLGPERLTAIQTAAP